MTVIRYKDSHFRCQFSMVHNLRNRDSTISDFPKYWGIIYFSGSERWVLMFFKRTFPLTCL